MILSGLKFFEPVPRQMPSVNILSHYVHQYKMFQMCCYLYCDDAVIVTDVFSTTAVNKEAECARLARLRDSDAARMQQLDVAAKQAKAAEAAASKKAAELQA